MKETRISKPARLMLAHINDTHSYFEPTPLQLDIPYQNKMISPYVSAGGFARVSARAKQLRLEAKQQNKGFLFLHAGDCFQGTLYFSLFKGRANADMLNALQIDAMAVGNHELDMGNDPVVDFAHRVDFPLLAGNWNLNHELTDKPKRISKCHNVKSYHQVDGSADTMIRWVDDEPIAIFGLSLDKMDEISNPDSDTPFVNAIATAKSTINKLNAQGINKIILLSHLGYEADVDLATKVNGLSLIIGGHSHRLQGDFSDLGLGKDDEYGRCVNGTRIVQSGFHAQTMGHCEIEFSSTGEVTSFSGKNELLLGRQLFLDAKLTKTATDEEYQQVRRHIDHHPNVVVIKRDPDVHEILMNKYLPQVRLLQREVLAHSNHKLRHVRLPDEQGPSELAPMVAESFYYALIKQGIDLDFAIHNAGGVRNSLHAGDVTVADIAGKVLPFAVPIGHYEVTGATLRMILEGAIDNAINNGVEGTGSGSYPYTHNLSFDYVASAVKGQRIKDLRIYCSMTQTWKEVDNHAYYCGTSSAYTMKGKEGYDAICEMKGTGTVTSLSMADCMIMLLRDKPNRLSRTLSYLPRLYYV